MSKLLLSLLVTASLIGSIGTNALAESGAFKAFATANTHFYGEVGPVGANWHS